MAASVSVSVQACGRYLCLHLPLSAGLGHSAVDLCLIVSGLRPQFGNATAAEVLWTGLLWPLLICWPLMHVANGAVDSWRGRFGPSWVSSLVFAVPAWAAASVELWSCASAGRIYLSVITVAPAALLSCLALELHLSAHFSPAVLEPHLWKQTTFFYCVRLNSANIHSVSIDNGLVIQFDFQVDFIVLLVEKIWKWLV